MGVLSHLWTRPLSLRRWRKNMFRSTCGTFTASTPSHACQAENGGRRPLNTEHSEYRWPSYEMSQEMVELEDLLCRNGWDKNEPRPGINSDGFEVELENHPNRVYVAEVLHHPRRGVHYNYRGAWQQHAYKDKTTQISCRTRRHSRPPKDIFRRPWTWDSSKGHSKRTPYRPNCSDVLFIRSMWPMPTRNHGPQNTNPVYVIICHPQLAHARTM